MMRLFLIIVALILVPPALSYGVDPAAMLPKTMDITVQGTDQTEMLRAIMGLYFGMSAFCLIAAFKPEWRHVAMVWAVFFLYSMGLGRLLSLVVDGIPSRILLFYMAVELTGGTIGLAILARERRKAQARALSGLTESLGVPKVRRV